MKQMEKNFANSAKTCKVEQNPAWSEEDKKRFESTLHRMEIVGNGCAFGQLKDDIEWLKSLKERYTWKPSESDILLLERIANGKSNPQDFQASLCGLIGQLKELKG